MAKRLTHVADDGSVRMVDVGDKPVQKRLAEAEGFIHLSPETVALIRQAAMKKGDVLTTAEIAGIQGAKQTATLIPLCHPLITDQITVKAELEDKGVRIFARVYCRGRTGAEMEALTAVSIALLTVYDMCKAVDKKMVLDQIHLVRKEKE